MISKNVSIAYSENPSSEGGSPIVLNEQDYIIHNKNNNINEE